LPTEHRADVAVIGAGIVGLAHALAAARRGLRVAVFEREQRAVGASVRNFGLHWPVGLALTPLHERALRGRARWLEAAAKAGFWCVENGSLFLAYHADEQAVLEEFESRANGSTCVLLTAQDVARRTSAAQTNGLRCGLFSATELTIDPREAIRKIPAWLTEAYGVAFRFGAPVNAITLPVLETVTESWRVERAFVCSGADFETLYPQHFAGSGLTKCKLQMLRTAPQPAGWRLGPTLCSGLTMARYDNFSGCPSIRPLRERLARDWPEHVRWSIHVMLAQNELGELITGDTHEYGLTFDPFDSERANQLILAYLSTFAQAPSLEIAERWHGIYSWLEGHSEFVAEPEPGVTIVQITNGLGMTLAFGMAEEIVNGEI
jgi:FAD dependent oxidoreductase TIGR03364